MNYEQFLEQLKEDLTARFAADLPPELSDVRIGIRDVEKLQGESYRGLSFRSGNSPVEANLNMTGAFQAYEAGRPYQDILHEVEDQLMKIVDRTPQFNIGELSDYEAMKPKLMMEVIPQKGNEDRLANIPHQKVEDMALIYRIDMGDSNGGKMTSVITTQQLNAFGITADQLHQDALENAPLTHPASLRSMRGHDGHGTRGADARRTHNAGGNRRRCLHGCFGDPVSGLYGAGGGKDRRRFLCSSLFHP